MDSGFVPADSNSAVARTVVAGLIRESCNFAPGTALAIEQKGIEAVAHQGSSSSTAVRSLTLKRISLKNSFNFSGTFSIYYSNLYK